MPACDGQTDGWTDVKPIAITCFSIADARKNPVIVAVPVSLSFVRALAHLGFSGLKGCKMVVIVVCYCWLVGIDSSDDDCDLELQLPRQRLWPGLSSDEEEERDYELVTVLTYNIFWCIITD